MTRFEVLTKKADELVARGRVSVPGVREELFKQAQDIRESLETMTVEDAADVIPSCKGRACTVKNCSECLSRGIRE